MDKQTAKNLGIPPNLPYSRYQAKPTVHIPSTGIPFIPKQDPGQEDPALKQRLVAHVRVFDLTNTGDLADYEKTWQRICDGVAMVSDQQINFCQEKGTYYALLRWSDVEFIIEEK